MNDYPNTNQQQIPWKMIAIIGGGLLAAIIIVGVVYRMVNKPTIPVQISTAVTPAQVDSLLANCETADDPESCKTDVSTSAAERSGSVEFCKELQGDEYDTCVWSAAQQNVEPELCASIANKEMRETCHDGVTLDAAFTKADVALCDNIKDEQKNSGCLEAFKGKITSENCADRGKDAAYCAFIEVSEQAALAQDKTICDQLGSEDQVQNCYEHVLIDDPDFDGLTTNQEIELGSDPRLSDTDGDGFTDGDEVAAGYSPTGPGTL